MNFQNFQQQGSIDFEYQFASGDEEANLVISDNNRDSFCFDPVCGAFTVPSLASSHFGRKQLSHHSAARKASFFSSHKQTPGTANPCATRTSASRALCRCPFRSTPGALFARVEWNRWNLSRSRSQSLSQTRAQSLS